MSKLYLVGIGPGSGEYLTFKAKKIADSSEILVGSRRALDLFKDSPAEKITLEAANMESGLKLAISRASAGNSVAILSTGDPGFSGILKPILNLAKNIQIEVVPGISSIQLCAAELQISWDKADLVTLHGKGMSTELLELIHNGRPTIILPDFKIEDLTRFLLENGVSPQKKVAVCEKLSYPEARVIKTTLDNILNYKFSYMCVMVIYS